MDNQIKNIQLKFRCDADWENMDVIDGAKHCEHCHKKVYDLTNIKQREFLMILAENNNNICGRFRKEQMAPKQAVLPAWKKWVSAAMFLIGINLLNTKAEAQQIKPKMQKQKVAADKQEIILGGIGGEYDEMPEFARGDAAFQKFMIKHLVFGKGMIGGRVLVSFNVNADGKLGNFIIERGLGPLNDNEVIAVLKSSPKWKPAMLNGKPVVCRYTIPVNFKK